MRFSTSLTKLEIILFCFYFREGFKKKKRTQRFSALDSGGWTRPRDGGQGRSSGLQQDCTAAARDMPWTPGPAAPIRSCDTAMSGCAFGRSRA